MELQVMVIFAALNLSPTKVLKQQAHDSFISYEKYCSVISLNYEMIFQLFGNIISPVHWAVVQLRGSVKPHLDWLCFEYSFIDNQLSSYLRRKPPSNSYYSDIIFQSEAVGIWFFMAWYFSALILHTVTFYKGVTTGAPSSWHRHNLHVPKASGQDTCLLRDRRQQWRQAVLGWVPWV